MRPITALPTRFNLRLTALAAALLAISPVHAQSVAPANAPDMTAPASPAIPVVTINASADASAGGLPGTYAGGQVARGGRIGLLGNVGVMDTPFNNVNYTQQLIQDQQSRGVADVLQNDPSVRVARGFGNFQELYMIRGFAVGSDDLAYNGLFGLLPRQFVAAELLERVEVLRGASSFINGTAPGGGIGGSINLLPKRATNTELTELTLGVESGPQGYAALDIGRRFGENNAAGVRINAVRRDGDSAIDSEQRQLSVLSLGFDYKGSGYRLSADTGYQDHRLSAARPSVNVDAGLAIPAAPKGSGNFAQPWTSSNERDTFGTIRGEVDLAQDAVLWAAFGARKGREANSLAEPTVNNANGDASFYRFDNHRKDSVQTGEIGVRGKLQTGSIGHSLSVSAASFHSSSKNAYALSSFFEPLATNIYQPEGQLAPAADFVAGGVLSDPLVTSKDRLTSVAVADTLGFAADTVLLTVGVRHQRIASDSYDYDTGASNEHYSASAVTPLAGLVVKFGKQFSVYGNYSEGLQKGQVATGTDIVNIGEVFAPYKARQKELGVKFDGGTLGMSAALFSTGQPSAYVENNVFGVFGKQRNRGLELSVYGAPVRGLRLLGGLTLLDAEQVVTAGGVNQGKHVIGVPTTQLNLGADWDVPGVTGLSLTGRVVHTSRQYADGANLQELPRWTRLDLGSRYTVRFGDREVILRGRIDNATGKDYWASAGGYPGAGYLVMGAPRTLALTGTVGF